MSDFLKKKLGEETFERVKRVLQNTKDPAKMLREEPWIISDICGEANLSIIDVGIAFDVFNAENHVIHPPTCINR
jgi:NIMA (never in mitosis gene a)-related kinase